MTIFRFDEEQLAPLKTDVIAAIVRSGWPTLLTTWERCPYGLGPRGYKVLQTLERTGGILLAMQAFLERRGNRLETTASNLSDAPISFGRLLAIHAAAAFLAGELDEITAHRVRTVNMLEPGDTRRLLTQDPLLDVILKDAILFVKNHIQKGYESDESLCAYAHLLTSFCRMQSQDPRYNIKTEELQSFSFELFQLHYNPFGKLQKIQSQPLLPVQLEDIVGNEEFLTAGRRLIRDVLAYDPKSGVNPKRINPILFGLGKPGCGKTASAHALGRHLLEQAKNVGLLAKFCVIRRTDWASAYQNASAFALIERFTSELEGFPGVVAFYWPDIDTAFGTRAGGDLHAEEKSILGAAFGLFDGTLLPNNGQWILICDANYMQMDDATISRLAQQPYLLEGPTTPQEYTKLVRDHLLGEAYAPYAGLSIKQWRAFGEKAAASELSGRDCSHFARRLCALMDDVEYPEGFFDANLETRQEMLRQARRRLSAREFFEQYQYVLDFVEDARKREEEEQINTRVQNWVRDEKARRRALRELQKISDTESEL